MPSKKGTESTLLNWVNTFPLDSKVESLAELSDGYVFSKMLEDLDPRYVVDAENHTSPSKWLAKKKSLEAVYKSLIRFIQNHCTAYIETALKDPVDFNAIAEHDDEQQTAKLLKIFLMAATRNADPKEYVDRIVRLDEEDQGRIAAICAEQEIPTDMQRESNFEDGSLPPKLTKDLDLAAEAAYAKLSADHDALTKRYADFLTRFERLEDSHDQLLSHSKEADRELEALRSSNNDSKANFISRLQAQVQEQNDLIATQEQQMETDRVIKERDQKELASLRPAAAKLLECEDKLKELKNDVATLTKKANMVDHFKGKLEQQKNIERENESLRWRIDVLEDNQKAFDKVHEENQKHVITAAEYEKRFASYENDVLQLSNQRRNLEEELRNQYDEVARLQSRQHHDERFIESLQEQIRTNTAGPPPSPGSPRAGPGALSLEQELEQSEDPTPNYSLENSRLKAEIQILKSTGAGTANATLRIELEEAERIRKRLEENLRDLIEKHAIGQMQLNAMIGNSSGEKLVQAIDRLMKIGPLKILTDNFYRNEAVISTRKLYLEANQELTSTKSRLAEIQTELSSRDRELLAARADLAAIDQEEIDALEDLKATNEIITTSFKNDLLILQNKHKALITDHEQQKTQLIDALLTKDRLVKDLASLREGGTGADGDDSYQKAQAKAIIEEENVRKVLQEQVKTQDTIIQDLQRRLKKAEESGPDAQKAENEAKIKNLIRENALISTAWYDLTSRLQSNHVVLQRRQDAPRSWLNKQRQMVNATPRR
ncbi:hypothetical protein N431DRAFT_408233 [Stipitochalara longipes BDJ]|nr:hypothetical protein N431DRAFT_408233 [Stipitochalara longipes BDJ]